MKTSTFTEYEAAKNEVLFGKEYVEESNMTNNVTRKTYSTKDGNGALFQVAVLHDDGTLETEFRSTVHPVSRAYVQPPHIPQKNTMERLESFNPREVAREIVNVLASYNIRINATDIVFDAVKQLLQEQKAAYIFATATP